MEDFVFISILIIEIEMKVVKENVCQIFVQKFNFDKTPTFSRVFRPNFFENFSREIKVVNS